MGWVAITFLLMSNSPKAEFVQAFALSALDESRLEMIGSDSAPIVRRDRAGLQIVLSTDQNQQKLVGVATRFGLRGDFDIIAEIDLLKVEDPIRPQRVGVGIYVIAESPAQDAAALWWLRRATSEGVRNLYTCERVHTDSYDERQHRNREVKANTTKTVRLRMVRTGSQLTYYESEATRQPFRKLHTDEFVKEDIDHVRIAADNRGSPTAVNVRLKRLYIASDSFVDAKALPTDPSTRPSGPSAFSMFLAIFFVCVSFIAWRHWKRLVS